MAWIGFDFDGTLAREYTLEPVKPMVDRLRTYLRNGTECRIVTARAGDGDGILLVKGWLREHDLPDLAVTDKKDYQMIILFDDRARQVIPNTGYVIGEEESTPNEIILQDKKIIVAGESDED